MQVINGFSKLSSSEKIDIIKKHVHLDSEQIKLLNSFHDNLSDLDSKIKNLSENYVSNFVLPFSIAPNFRVNNKWHFVPMVTEESSVVAAASYAAKLWSKHGGFTTEVVNTTKSGQIYFTWSGDIIKLQLNFPILKEKLFSSVKHLTDNMVRRGGGVSDITLNKNNNSINDYYIIDVEFKTADSMGANLINSCLEIMGSELILFISDNFSAPENEAEIIMAILSNFTPQCLVECKVECDIKELAEVSGNLSAEKFAWKFRKAVEIADENVSRAVTHNKGIFNGVDAVLLATANDFRAVEACGHAYAARDGKYRSLTSIEINNNRFTYNLRLPLALGTVGGATSVHPLSILALQIMDNPTSGELMQIVASVGLASNFAAIRSLITDGIQKGHMKLHIRNIMTHFKLTEVEKTAVEEHFYGKPYSFKSISDYLSKIRETE